MLLLILSERTRLFSVLISSSELKILQDVTDSLPLELDVDIKIKSLKCSKKTTIENNY